jgi:hypothetical protein
LPVPNRAALEAELISQGWTIEGDEATRAKKGFMASLRGSDKKHLPRQGTLDELVAEARVVLDRMSGVPTPEAQALRRRMQRTQTAAVSAKIPVAAAPPPQPLPARAQPVPKVRTEKSEWMKDFVDAHRAPSRPAPRVSSPARAVSHKATPAWMEDFAPDKPNDDSDE